MPYQAVLFDMDGVLLDSEPLHYEATKRTWARHGHHLTYDEYKRHFGGKTDKEGFTEYGKLVGMTTAAVRGLLAEKARAYQAVAAGSAFQPCAGTLEYIDWLVTQGVPIALVTGSLRAEAELVLRAFRLENAFSALVAAEDVAHGKPHPEGYLKGAAALGVEPEACIVVEDAPSGIAAARSAGMRCIALTTTYDAGELTQAHHIVAQLRPGTLIPA
ncbi:MAG TPA: HAD family phosphatase [Candidatus Saccharimonadales bacterium]|nr:HAD family phosphatase [Candidatus Saccharimonadales bacterium]